ncbi:hypothetical protein DVZ84_07835 [Streptomyces parvulus]|uniref:Uncharacterized protein n=1 Tax=Streptomyces parvulus TaxID=146923 RepID=A0A369VD86_9ACTN|nr:hypothetical protein DVZ84_07835 [Streptomyces parvulus]
MRTRPSRPKGGSGGAAPRNGTPSAPHGTDTPRTTEEPPHRRRQKQALRKLRPMSHPHTRDPGHTSG